MRSELPPELERALRLYTSATADATAHMPVGPRRSLVALSSAVFLLALAIVEASYLAEPELVAQIAEESAKEMARRAVTQLDDPELARHLSLTTALVTAGVREIVEAGSSRILRNEGGRQESL